MTTVLFDVNDSVLRRGFLTRIQPEAMDALMAESRPVWGAMGAQHMAEHLLWAFEFSTGSIVSPRQVPETVVQRMKPFLYNNRRTPREFKNPLLKEEPPQFRFASLRDASNALKGEVDRFYEQLNEDPSTTRTHPLFGPLNGEEWERAMFKHSFHHLLQFGLIEEQVTGER